MKLSWVGLLALCPITAMLGVFLLSGKAGRSLSANDEVLNSLASVPTFAFGGIGFALATSQGETDYRTIAARPSAKADFEKLLTRGNAQARCYALAGLRKLDRARFDVLSQQVRKSGDIVETMSGCIMRRESVEAVVARIESGAYSKELIA